MPKTSKQNYGTIIYALQGKDMISKDDLRAALATAGVESDSAISRYKKSLVDRGYLIPVGDDCWQLTEESMQTGIITVKVVPKQSTEDVANAVEAICTRFGKRVTVEAQEVEP